MVRRHTGEHNHGQLDPDRSGDTHYVTGTGEYQTVQAAHDALSDVGIVQIDSSYDPTNETFPINWTKRAGLVGNGVTWLGDPANDVDVILNVTGGPDGKNRPPGAWFQNVQIQGGLRCVDVANFRWTVWTNCHFTEAFDDGIKFDQVDTGAVNSHALFGCTAEKNGRDGFWSSPSAYAVELHNCTGQDNGRYGAKLSANASARIIGGAYQINGEQGVWFDSMESGTLRDAYVEANSELAGNSDIMVDNTSHSVVIEGNYINSVLGPRDPPYAVEVQNSEGTQFRANNVLTSAGMTALVSVDANSKDTDVYHPTNTEANDPPNGISTVDDAGVRTRSHGTIGAASGGVDLSTVTGAVPGDLALDAVTNSLHSWNGTRWVAPGGKVLLGSHSDADTATPFSATFPSLGDYGSMELRFSIEEHSGVANRLGVQYNGDALANYYYTELDNATLVKTTADTSFKVADIRSNRYATGSLDVGASGVEAVPSDANLGISGGPIASGSQGAGSGSLLRGFHGYSSGTGLDQLDVFTSGNATGRVAVYGSVV